jgi:formate/nitrite transporter
MDYVSPAEVISDAVKAAEKKAGLSIGDLLVRGALAGVFLGFATSLAFTSVTQGVPAIVGAIIFPVGFVMLVLLGLELATGNFALLPMALMEGRIGMGALLRNWTWVYVGNLIGSVLYALLFYAAITSFGSTNGAALGDLVRQTAVKKTVAYAALGGAGWGTAFVKALLCNWMVTVGSMLAFASRSTAGKILGMWLPITTFFAHGYEHSVVNMFVVPAGMLLGAPVSMSQWWIWNQIPVTLGNIFAGALFTGVALWWTHARKREDAAMPAMAAVAAKVRVG